MGRVKGGRSTPLTRPIGHISCPIFSRHQINAETDSRLQSATIKEHSTQEVSAGNPFEGFGALLEFGPFEVESRELYTAYKRWSIESGVRPLKELDFKTALERYATKGKHHIEHVRMLNSYTPSLWINDRQERVMVYPALADLKSRPYGYRGVCLAEGHFGSPIGQELPKESVTRRDFEQ